MTEIRNSKGEVVSHNIAKIIYGSYRGSDLLPVGEEHLGSFRVLYDHVCRLKRANEGDALFNFIVIEAFEGSETSWGVHHIPLMVEVLHRSVEDIQSVLNALEEIK